MEVVDGMGDWWVVVVVVRGGVWWGLRMVGWGYFPVWIKAFACCGD